LVVTIPPANPNNPSKPTGSPTGIIANGSTTDFVLAPGKPANFIFATLDGTIAAWNLGNDKFDGDPHATGSRPFEDSQLPGDYVPFNVATVGNDVVVTYVLDPLGQQLPTAGPASAMWISSALLASYYAASNTAPG
jgi:hypothetical protein